MQNDNAEMFNDITQSKRKNIDNANIIFNQSTAKEYDFIVSKKLNNSTLTQGNKGREFRQIVVNGDTGAYDGTAGKPMKKENSQRDRSGPRDRSGD